MKWIAIAGTWHHAHIPHIEEDVRREVAELIQKGNGIITGGAPGVDFFAIDEALKNDPSGSHIKIFLPSTVEQHAAYYRTKDDEGLVTSQEVEKLISQIEKLPRASIIQNPFNDLLNKEVFFDCTTRIINAADELIAFQINNSEGTQDAIDKAEQKGIPLKKYAYSVLPS